MGFIQFSSGAQLGASMRITGMRSNSWFMLEEGEPSFKEASPAVMLLVKSQLSLAWVVQNCFQFAIFV
jgi:hypothetical protein